MLQIRKKVFETNSSSTHALAVNKYKDITIDNELEFEKPYIIKPFTEAELHSDNIQFTTIEDKLRYFLTVYNQCWEKDDDDVLQFMRLLQRIFPNTIFCHSFKKEYVFEDGEWFFQDGWKEPMECTKMMTEYTLKQFMIHGSIYYFNRDDLDYEDDIMYNIENNNETILVKFSG